MSKVKVVPNDIGGLDVFVDGEHIKRALAMRFEKRGGEPGRLTLEFLATSIELEADADVLNVRVDER